MPVLAGGVPVSEGDVDYVQPAAVQGPIITRLKTGMRSDVWRLMLIYKRLLAEKLFWIQKILQVDDLFITFCSTSQACG